MSESDDERRDNRHGGARDGRIRHECTALELPLLLVDHAGVVAVEARECEQHVDPLDTYMW